MVEAHLEGGDAFTGGLSDVFTRNVDVERGAFGVFHHERVGDLGADEFLGKVAGHLDDGVEVFKGGDFAGGSQHDGLLHINQPGLDVIFAFVNGEVGHTNEVHAELAA